MAFIHSETEREHTVRFHWRCPACGAVKAGRAFGSLLYRLKQTWLHNHGCGRGVRAKT